MSGTVGADKAQAAFDNIMYSTSEEGVAFSNNRSEVSQLSEEIKLKRTFVASGVHPNVPKWEVQKGAMCRFNLNKILPNDSMLIVHFPDESGNIVTWQFESKIPKWTVITS